MSKQPPEKPLTQIAKMKMNFIGLHTYPYDPVPNKTGSNEPTVWVGLTDDLDATGRIRPAGAYPTSYANTQRGQWGYAPRNTSSFGWGSAQLFPADCYAPPPSDATSCPYPTTASAQLGNAGLHHGTPPASPLWPRTPPASGLRGQPLRVPARTLASPALSHRIASPEPSPHHPWGRRPRAGCFLPGRPL